MTLGMLPGGHTKGARTEEGRHSELTQMQVKGMAGWGMERPMELSDILGRNQQYLVVGGYKEGVPKTDSDLCP